MNLSLKIASLCAASALALPCMGDDGTDVMLIHQLGADAPVSVKITPGMSVTFSESEQQMRITGDEAQNPMSFDISQIEKITFDLVTTPSDVVEKTLGDVRIVNDHGIVTISATGLITYHAWSINGVQVCGGTATESVTIDFTSKPKGVYIVNANGKTIKFINN